MAFEVYDVRWGDAIAQGGQMVVDGTVDTVAKMETWCAENGYENVTVTAKASAITNSKGGGVIRPQSSGGRPIA